MIDGERVVIEFLVWFFFVLYVMFFLYSFENVFLKGICLSFRFGFFCSSDFFLRVFFVDWGFIKKIDVVEEC